LTLLRLNTCANDNVTFAIEGSQRSFALCLATRISKHDFILTRVHCNHGVIAEILLAAILCGGGVLDLERGFLRTLVGIDNSDLGIKKIGEDVGFEGHGSAQRVMAVDQEHQDGVIIWQIGDRECSCTGISDLKIQFVASLQGRRKLLARLVWHGLGRQLGLAMIQIKGSSIGIGIAHPEGMLELQGSHEAASCCP